MFNIIEDCSPFYVRFNFTGIETLITHIKSISPESFKNTKFLGYIDSEAIESEAERFLQILPLSEKFKFRNESSLPISIFEYVVSSSKYKISKYNF